MKIRVSGRQNFDFVTTRPEGGERADRQHARLSRVATFMTLLAIFASGVARAEDEPGSGSSQFEGTTDTLSIFGVFAAESPTTGDYKIPVVAWVHEHETDELRTVTLKGLQKAIGITDGTRAAELFQDRVSTFLDDNERGETVVMTLGETQEYVVGITNDAGFATSLLSVPREDALTAMHEEEGRRWLKVGFQTAKTGGTHQLPVLSAEGVSVISDIDDTVKISEVLDRKALVMNTFAREFRAVPEMADLYRDWSKKGYDFHYLSAGPWQLARPLDQFLEKEGFPAGVLHLRPLRLKSPRSLHDFVTESERSKVERIEQLIRLFPKRQFILVGDSGERDPEVYGKVARNYPLHVMAIYIRKVKGALNDQARFRAAFEKVSPAKIRIFAVPEELRSSTRKP